MNEVLEQKRISDKCVALRTNLNIYGVTDSDGITIDGNLYKVYSASLDMFSNECIVNIICTVDTDFVGKEVIVKHHQD